MKDWVPLRVFQILVLIVYAFSHFRLGMTRDDKGRVIWGTKEELRWWLNQWNEFYVHLRRQVNTLSEENSFKRNIVTVVTVTLLHGEASSQWENMQITVRKYSEPGDLGSWIKSHFQWRKGPPGGSSLPCDTFTVLPGLCFFGRWGKRTPFILGKQWSLPTNIGGVVDLFPHDR